jgi:large subunit ribosomal protein L21
LQVARFPGRHPAGVKERAKIVMTDTEPGAEPEQPPVRAKARSKSASSSASYAIIETGGKQYRVAVGDTLSIEKLPLLAGATVQAQVEQQYRGPKIVVFKYKPKKRYRRRTGHRQSLTRVAITAINA